MEAVQEARPLEAASPRRLWLWAWVIALVGVALRVIWFSRYRDSLPLGLGQTFSGHLWWLPDALRLRDTGQALDSFALTRGFAPGYGVLLRGAWEVSGGSLETMRSVLLIAQSLMAGAATLVTFALGRRVLFGFWSLLPPLLVTASLAVIELPGGLAPQVPLMLSLVLAIWLITVLRERVPDLTGAAPVFLTLGGGLLLGASILFSPACILIALIVCWWAFRGVGREHAVLLLVATVLLPACWIAIVQTQAAAGLPTEQANAWAGAGQDNVVRTPGAALDRAYAVATPWNPRFSRGAWESTNWNYEWALPLSLRGGTTYLSATRVLAAFWMLAYLALVLAGLIALFAEGAGSAARLVAIPAICMPLITFLTANGGLLRVSVLPFLMIALVVGAAWLAEKLQEDGGEVTAG